MANNTRKRAASAANIDSNPGPKAKATKKPSASKTAKKPGSQKQQPGNPTAWDAVTTQYPAEINMFFPTLDSVSDNLSIVKHLASLPAIDGALDNRTERVGSNPFTLELGSKGSIKAHDKYQHFHSRNQNSRAQGNLKAVLAQASGTPAPVACSRCSQNRTLWATCMKAPAVPGLDKQDALNGACPGCYYNGTGNGCSNRPAVVKKDDAQPALPSVAEAESSSMAAARSRTASKASTAASSTSTKQGVPEPDHAVNHSGSAIEKGSGTGALDADKMQLLKDESKMLLKQYKSLLVDTHVLLKQYKSLSVDKQILQKEKQTLKNENQILHKDNQILHKDNQILHKDNHILQMENESLQARVYELEDIIEAEEQQCMI